MRMPTDLGTMRVSSSPRTTSVFTTEESNSSFLDDTRSICISLKHFNVFDSLETERHLPSGTKSAVGFSDEKDLSVTSSTSPARMSKLNRKTNVMSTACCTAFGNSWSEAVVTKPIRSEPLKIVGRKRPVVASQKIVMLHSSPSVHAAVPFAGRRMPDVIGISIRRF